MTLWPLRGRGMVAEKEKMGICISSAPLNVLSQNALACIILSHMSESVWTHMLDKYRAHPPPISVRRGHQKKKALHSCL